ncbi:Uncharacterised protein [Vibrio cholerae]|nr:Uncharacterised protein [Vibrio cholerae]
MYLLIPARRRILAELILHPYGYLLWGHLNHSVYLGS